MSDRYFRIIGCGERDVHSKNEDLDIQLYKFSTLVHQLDGNCNLIVEWFRHAA